MTNLRTKDTVICGDCLEVMKDIPDKSIDLTVTSPPYDNLRTYNGYSFDFEGIAKELYRVTKDGGVVVWVVGDATIKGSETGTSFKQALYFKEIGFNLHDTMIYYKKFIPKTHNRYEQEFEYMFVFSKGKPKTFNPILEPSKYAGQNKNARTMRQDSDELSNRSGKGVVKPYRIKGNIWRLLPDHISSHPAIFPEKLSEDHILSWSNESDTVLDPMCGSGTTCKMAQENKRHFIGIEISQEYCDIANERLRQGVLL
jgi:DNA modification methylase